MIRTAAIFAIVLFVTLEAKEWERYEFPNPRLNPDMCGHNKVSYICDPDKYLEEHQANLLDKEIELVMNYTKCPCASYACDKGTRGYKIGVAIVDKMMKNKGDQKGSGKSMDKVDENLEDSLRFSYHLLNEWNLGECQEDLIIFYSVQDHVVYTTTNELTRKKLDNYLVGEISIAHRKQLQGGDYYNGIKSLILDYKKVLMGNYARKTSDPAGPQYAAVVGSESSFSFPCLATVLLLSLVTSLLH